MPNLPTVTTVFDIAITTGHDAGVFEHPSDSNYLPSKAYSRINLGTQYPSSVINLPYFQLSVLPGSSTVMTAKSLFGNSTVAIDTASKAGYVRAIVTMLASSSSTVTDDIILMFN